MLYNIRSRLPLLAQSLVFACAVVGLCLRGHWPLLAQGKKIAKSFEFRLFQCNFAAQKS